MTLKLIVTSILLFSVFAFSQQSEKILVLYSSINRGHIQVAETVKSSLLSQGVDPANIVLKDVREFQGAANRTLAKGMYDALITRYPKVFSRFYDSFLSRGETVMALSHFENRLDMDEVSKYISSEKPKVILATHHGAATALGLMREKGELRDVRLGWLHTDFITSYFPRISKSIDQTFVLADFLKQKWIDKGVSPDKVDVSGMTESPVSVTQKKSIDVTPFELNPALPIVSVDLGTSVDGSDLIKVIDSIGNRFRKPVQVVAKNNLSSSEIASLGKKYPYMKVSTTKNNKNHFEIIEKNATVAIVPSSYVNTKLPNLGVKPVIAYDAVAGVDSANLAQLKAAGILTATDKTYRVGYLVNTLIEDAQARTNMQDAQLSFLNGQQIQKIVDFAKQPGLIHDFDVNLGVESGNAVQLTREALAKLDRDTPADVEILLAYGKYPNGDFFTNDGNPFGHLAIRVKDKVYTVNGLAKIGVEKEGIHVTTLEDYLYSIKRVNVNEEHTDTFGGAYARHSLSIRASGLSEATIAKMLQYIDEKQAAWTRQEWTWKAREYNCADFVEDVLKAGGLVTKEHKSADHKVRGFTFPLDVFDRYLDYFESSTKYRSEIVAFTYVPESKNLYKRPTFPLTAYQPKRLFGNMLGRDLKDEERKITKRIAFYPTDHTAHYENVDGSSAELDKQAIEQAEKTIAAEFTELESAEKALQARRQQVIDGGMTTQNMFAKLDSMPAGPELQEQIRQWNEVQKGYQNDLDALIVKQLDHFANKIIFYMESIRINLQHKVSPEDYKELLALQKFALEAHEGYLRMKPRYGQAKDIPRTAKYRALYERSEKFVKFADKIAGDSEQPTKGKGAAKIYIKLSKNVMALVGKIVFYSKENTDYLKEGNKLARAFGDLVGASVEVKGKEIIAALPKKKGTVNLIAPIHRHPVWDMVAYANIGVDDALPFIFFPKPVARFISKQFSNVIAVGGGSDLPIENAIAEIKKGYTTNLLIYPEGSVSAGMMETRPGREKFAWGLVRRLRAEGYEVNIVPISYENTAKFGNENTIGRAIDKAINNPEKEVFKVEVGKPLTTKMVDQMLAVDDQSINRYIRGFWLENMITDATYFSGQLRPAAMDTLVREQFTTKRLKVNSCLKFYGGM